MLERALVDMVCHMIRLKLFDNARFRGLFVFAIDATKQERIRCCKWLGNRKNRYVLEVKLITPFGAAFSVMSEPIKPWHDNNENEKQDSEYHGFLRVAPRLKAAFPNLGICILGDALYACAPLMKVCENYGWEYIFTFKEGRTLRAYKDAEEQMKAAPGQSGKCMRHDAKGKPVECVNVAWATGIEITKGSDGWHVFNVVKIVETDANGAPYSGMFATSFDIRDAKGADAIATCGRRRWGIETSFYVEKHVRIGLGHNFCNNARVSRNIYLLMQIAYNLWQLFNLGCLKRLGKGCRLMTEKKWAEIMRSALKTCGIELDLESLPRRYISREYLQ